MKSKFRKLQPFKITNQKVTLELRRFPAWDNKYWLVITLYHSPSEWIISLDELGRIIRAIGWAEDYKYPNGKGRLMLLDFLQDCLWNKTSIEDLLTKYQIPVRK